MFSSFAALLSFNLKGKFKGLAQVISWSALDEQMHHEMGCQLFRQFCELELDDNLKAKIVKAFGLIIQNEYKFIDSILKGEEVNGLTTESMVNFIHYRANKALANLGIKYEFPYHFSIDTVKEWFEPLVSGNSSNDFFSQAKDGANYAAKLDINLKSININNINNWLKGTR